MERITITIDGSLRARLDAYMTASGATNRSEAMRDLVRRGLNDEHEQPGEECIAVVSYALDPNLRDLGRRVPQSRHERHDRVIAALSAPIDHSTAVEVAVMKGTVREMSDYANSLFLERGIHHGKVSLIPVITVTESHSHGSGEAHTHTHLRLRQSS